jgi:hypothetical protein
MGTIISSNTVTASDGSITTVSKDTNGNTQTTKVTSNGVATTTVTNSQGQQVSSSSNSNQIAQVLKDPMTWETMGAQAALEILLHSPKIYQKLSAAASKFTAKLSEVLVQKVAEKDASHVLKGAGVKVGENAAEKAAEKAAASGTKIAAQTEVAADTGPGAPFVEVAEMAFNMFSGAMDGLNLGGFSNGTNMTLINSMKTEVDNQFQTAFTSQNVDFPVITGPFDTLDPNVYQTNLTSKVTDIYKQKVADIQAGWANGSIPKLPSGSTSDDYVNYFDSKIDMDACFDQASSQYCTQLNGSYVKHPKSSNMYCSYTQSQCNPKWPMGPDDTYYEWNKTDNACEVRPSYMRSYCEKLGLGVTYNMDTGSCNLTQSYCARYGADEGLKNGDCKYSKGEQIAETIFGKTIVDSIVNIFGDASYAPCPPGNTINPLNVLDPLSEVWKSKPSAARMLCATDKCPDGYDKMGGICYPKCPDGYSRKADAMGNQVNGMCYKCPDGYNPSTAGLCHRDGCDPGKEAGSGIGIGFCYPPCPPGKVSDGATQCLDKCPAGYDTLPLTCQRNPKTVTDSGTVAKCPPGWNTTVQGPGGMCQQGCPTGQKLYLGTCYDNAVDSNLDKVPHYSCPSGATNTGLLCTTPLKCSTDWCPGHKKQGCCLGPFWYICNAAKTTCSGGGTVPASASCPAGYTLRTGMCYANSHGVPPSKPLSEVGVCDADRDHVGGMCYKKCSDPSWGAGPGFTRSAAGSCLFPADTKSRNPTTRGAGVPKLSDKHAQTVGPQAPHGISYNVFPRKRITPFPSTSDSDFKNSPIGSHIQDGINAARNGDITGLGKAMAATAMVTNPVVLTFNASDLANIGAQKAGLGGQHGSTS